MWRGERRSAEEFEKRVTHSQKEIASLTARIGDIEARQAKNDLKAAITFDSLNVVTTTLKIRSSHARARISPQIATSSDLRSFVGSMDSLVSNLEVTNVAQSDAFAIKIRSFGEIIRLEREKGTVKDSLIINLVGENKALNRDLKKQKIAKNVFKSLFGIGVVAAVILLSQ